MVSGLFGDGIDGLLPLLLLSRERTSRTSCTTTSSSSSEESPTAAASFLAYLQANVGRRVKFMLSARGPGNFTGVLPLEVTARLVAVDTDFAYIEEICINGHPVTDPLRAVLTIAYITGVEVLTERDRLFELLCALD